MKSLLLILTVLMVGCDNDDEQPINNPQTPEEIINAASAPCDSAKMDHLSAYPVDMDARVLAILPLGNTNGSGHIHPTQHIYFRTNAPNNVPLKAYLDSPVYAPGNLAIKAIEWKKDSNDLNDYRIHFQACDYLRFYYDHMSFLSQELRQVAEEEGLDTIDPSEGVGEFIHCTANKKECFLNLKIPLPVKAGMKIGGVFRKDQPSLDFGVKDERFAPTGLVRPPRFDYGKVLTDLKTQYLGQFLPALSNDDMNEYLADVAPKKHYSSCALNFYPNDQKALMLARIKNYDGSLPANPHDEADKCFTIKQDVAGTAQGHWYAGKDLSLSSFIDESQHLGLIKDNLSKNKYIFSVGPKSPLVKDAADLPAAWTPNKTQELTFQVANLNNLAFDKVNTIGKTYCYEDLINSQSKQSVAGIIVMKLVDAGTLQIEFQNVGSCEKFEDFFKSATFYR